MNVFALLGAPLLLAMLAGVMLRSLRLALKIRTRTRTARRTRAADATYRARFTFRAPTLLARYAAPVTAVLGWIGVVVLVGAEGSMHPNDALAFLVLMSAILYLGWSQNHRADVGMDGVYVHDWTGHFHPFRGDETVSQEAWGLTIWRGRRSLFDLHVGPIQRAYLGRIEAFLDAVIADAGRDPEETRSAMSTLLASGNRSEHAGAYRAVSTQKDDLWRVIESPMTPSVLRVRAARELANARLSRGGDFDARDEERLQILSNSCVEPTVRATLVEMVDSSR